MKSTTVSSSFISVVTLFDASRLNALPNIEVLQHRLQELYSDYEILVVAKKDAQNPITGFMNTLLQQTPSIRWIQLASNVPDEVALAAGMENAIGDFVVLIDIWTDPIELIEQSVVKCKTGIDVIVGTAKASESLAYSLLRPMATFLLKRINYLLPRNSTLFRCLSRRAANAVIASSSNFHQQLFMQIQKTGYESASLGYEFLKSHKKSLYSGFRETMRLMVFNSSAPLRFMSVLGLLGSGIGCLFSIYAVVLRFLREDIVSGWASTVLLISVFSFLQFVILAFISEYLGRLLHEQGHKDDYSIVFERNSLTMVNQDRLNVLEQSINPNDQNLVQTGRDR